MRSDAGLQFDPESAMGRPLDIEKTTAFSHSGNERNHLFLNLAGRQFLDVSAVSGADDPADGRACGMLDYDRDGWQDILVVNANSPFTRLWRNGLGERPETAKRSWFVALRFAGSHRDAAPTTGRTNRDGYGARAFLTLSDGRTLLREYRCGEGMAAQNSSTMLVGLGESEAVEALRVAWPGGREQETARVGGGSLVTVYEDPAQSPTGAAFVVQPYEPVPVRPVASGDGAALVLASAERLRGGRDAELTLLTTTASWCAKCKAELPQLAALRSAFDERALVLRGIPADPTDTRDKLAAYVAEFRPAYEMSLDLSPAEVRVVTAAVQPLTGSEQAFPATLVVDRQGRVLLRQTGVPTVSQLRKLLNLARS